MHTAELVVDCENTHGEGVFWNPADQRLWWTDIPGEHIWSYKPESGETSKHKMPDRVCCFAPSKTGDFIVAFVDRISFYSLHSGELACLHSFEAANLETRLNDGRVDRHGNFIVGGMNDVTSAADSSVIRVNSDLSVTRLLADISCANSICFSPLGDVMYFADTPKRQIMAFDYQPENPLLGERVYADLSAAAGFPDGSCVDSQGGVWNAEWEGGRVVRRSAVGNVEQVIELPVWKPTCCAFGGVNLDILYITTSCLMTPAQRIQAEPGSGGLFAFKPGVQGIADQPFAG